MLHVAVSIQHNRVMFSHQVQDERRCQIPDLRSLVGLAGEKAALRSRSREIRSLFLHSFFSSKLVVLIYICLYICRSQAEHYQAEDCVGVSKHEISGWGCALAEDLHLYFAACKSTYSYTDHYTASLRNFKAENLKGVIGC